MKKITFLFALTIVTYGIIRAQNESDEFTKIRQSIRENVSKEMIGWTSHSVEPIEGSRDVLIEHWELGDIIVKIAVTKYKDEDNAARGLSEFKSHLIVEEKAQSNRRGKPFQLIKEELRGIGDEGFVIDNRGSESVAFRKGKFVVNISVPHPADNTDVFFSRQFAHHVLKAIEDK